jgi:Zn-dependent protease with chaperone function
MSPSKVLNFYYALAFAIGTVLSIFLAHWVETKDIGVRGAAVLNLSINVFFIMVLPLVLDWAERRYFKARFLLLEELAFTNPELATVLQEQCSRLAIPNLRLAIVHSANLELFSYGLWRNNPRLIVSDSFLTPEEQARIIPSIEAELARFATQDRTMIFLMFAALQEIIQLLILVRFPL